MDTWTEIPLEHMTGFRDTPTQHADTPLYAALHSLQ